MEFESATQIPNSRSPYAKSCVRDFCMEIRKHHFYRINSKPIWCRREGLHISPAGVYNRLSGNDWCIQWYSNNTWYDVFIFHNRAAISCLPIALPIDKLYGIHNVNTIPHAYWRVATFLSQQMIWVSVVLFQISEQLHHFKYERKSLN